MVSPCYSYSYLAFCRGEKSLFKLSSYLIIKSMHEVPLENFRKEVRGKIITSTAGRVKKKFMNFIKQDRIVRENLRNSNKQ